MQKHNAPTQNTLASDEQVAIEIPEEVCTHREVREAPFALHLHGGSKATSSLRVTSR